jgi:exodeoxyribonuclease VII small subunit
MSNKKKSVEEDMCELESIVGEFEKGAVSLEDSVAKYKKATNLIKKIRSELESIETKINEIK